VKAKKLLSPAVKPVLSEDKIKWFAALTEYKAAIAKYEKAQKNAKKTLNKTEKDAVTAAVVKFYNAQARARKTLLRSRDAIIMADAKINAARHEWYLSPDMPNNAPLNKFIAPAE
jgi:hypothetical protein